MYNFKINNKVINYDQPCFIIAEIGNNHNGIIENAFKLVDAAIESGADAVKFQVKDIETAFSKKLLDSPYINENSFGKTYREHKKQLELSHNEYAKIKEYCDSKKIIFFATPFEETSLNFLKSIKCEIYKLSSFHNNNKNFIQKFIDTDCFFIISTGMSDKNEVDEIYNFVRPKTNKFALLQCTSSYPTNDEDVNLLVIKKYCNDYDCIIGYSGHERGISISSASVLLGAKIIERHFTLDRTLKGADHSLSLEPKGLKLMVERIRLLENALGNEEKKVLTSELQVRKKNRGY